MLKNLLFSLTLVSALAAFTPPSAAGPLHFDLSKSAPAADAHVASPSEIRLWFTQEPQDGSTRIRLMDADGDLVETGEVTQDADEPMSFSIAVDDTLPNGMYTVAWRGMGADGHVVQGTFEFMVMGS